MPSSLHPPRKAVLLAAGFGARLAPLTLETPKPLLPFQGVPMAARALRMLKDWGVRDVAVNVHHRADRMLEELPKLCPPGLRLTLSFEPDILGTGGPLRRLEGFPGGEPFWLLNADVVMELNPRPLLEAFRNDAPLAALWMIPDAGPRTVKVEGGRVVDFRSGGMTFSGLHLLSPEILKYLPKEEVFFSIITAYERAMRAGKTVLGLTVPGSRWADIGTPESWLAAEGRSIVLPGARVAAGVKLDAAIVGPGVHLRRGRRAGGMVLRPDQLLDAEEQAWVPDAEAVETLAARGSDRAYFRVHRPENTVILMRWGEARPENDRFVSHTRFLRKQGLRVPEILRHSPRNRRLLLEDAGRTHLLDAPGPAHTRKAVALAARLHGITGWERLSLEPGFDAALFQWEHELFFREFLTRHDPGTDPAPLRRAFAAAAGVLLTEPQVLLHRDLQSTNLLLHRGEAVLIDYQGMRAGPAAYDVASLLADPYLDRSPEEQRHLLALYNEQAQRPVDEAAYRAGAVQRLCQALGAYGRLGAASRTRRFLECIPPALRQIGRWTPDPALREWAAELLERQTRENTLGLSP